MEYNSEYIDNLVYYIDKILSLTNSNRDLIHDLVGTKSINNNGSIKEISNILLFVLEKNYNDLKSIIQKNEISNNQDSKISKDTKKILIDKELDNKISTLYRCLDKITDLSIKIERAIEEKTTNKEEIIEKLEQLLKNTKNIANLSSKAKNTILSNKIEKIFFKNNYYKRPRPIVESLAYSDEEILRASGEYLTIDNIKKLKHIKNKLKSVKSNIKNRDLIDKIIKIIDDMEPNFDENNVYKRSNNAEKLEKLKIALKDLELDYKNEKSLSEFKADLNDIIYNIKTENKKIAEKLMNDTKKLTIDIKFFDSENSLHDRLILDENKMILIENFKYSINETDNIPIELNYEDFSPSIFYTVFNDIINHTDNSYCFFTEKNSFDISAAEIIFKYFRAYDNDKNQKISTEELIKYFAKNNINPNQCTKLFEIFVKIGDIEMVRWFIMNGINLNTINNLDKISIISGNPDLIHYFEELGVEFNYNTLKEACSIYSINGPNVVNYLIDKIFSDSFFNKNNLIELFSVTKDPKIANIILNKFEQIGYNILTNKDNIVTSIFNNLFEKNNIPMIQYLTLSYPDIKLDKSLLCKCIKRNNLKIFKLLFNHKGMDNEKQKSDFGKSLLFELANNKKSIEITKFLFSKLNNMDLNVIYEQGRTLLHTAVINNNTKMVNFLLLSKGIEVNVPDEYGNTSFYYAFRLENFDIIKSFICNKNTDVNIKDDCKYPTENKTILYSAIEKNNIDIVKLLLNHKDIDSNIGYEKKYYDYSYDYIETPLIYAIKQGNIEVVKLLINNPNTNINEVEYTWDCFNRKRVKSEKIISPLYLAIEKENWEIVKLLLSCSAIDPNIGYSEYSCNIGKNEDFYKLNSRESVLDYAIGKRENIRYTKEYHYNCHSRESPLSCAINKNNCEIVKILVNNPKLNINVRNKTGKTPLQIAIYKKQPEIVKLLLTCPGIDINMENADNNKYKRVYDEIEECKEKPIHIAIKVGNEKIVRYLLKHPNIDINIIDSDGKTPLQRAIKKGNFNIVKIIINFIEEKEIKLTDKEKNELIDISIKKLNPDILEYLLEHLKVDITDEQINKLSENSDSNDNKKEEEEEEEFETKYKRSKKKSQTSRFKKSRTKIKKSIIHHNLSDDESDYDNDYDYKKKKKKVSKNKKESENKKIRILGLLEKYKTKNKNDQKIDTSKKLETVTGDFTLTFESVNITEELADKNQNYKNEAPNK